LLAPSSYYGPEGGGTYKWIDDNASSEPLLKQQSDEVVYELKSDVNFKSLVKI
jgi:hypothetical protein